MNAIDQQLFLMLNASSDNWGVMAAIAFVAAKMIIYLIPLHLVMIWVLGDRSVRRQALILLTALVAGLAVSYLIGKIVPTQRPYLIPIGHALVEHRSSPSFPSNHGLIMFTYAITMAMLSHWRHALVIGAAGLIVAWARIYVGVHFPFDMVGAVFVGALAAWLAIRFDRLFGARLLALADRLYALFVLRPARGLAQRFNG
ncbi:undecaprenyl-diphosphatase [Aliihoeflea sp. PC F10.4]